MHGDFATSLMLCASACRSADKHTPTILAAYAGERSRCARPVDNIGGESIRCLSVVQAWPGIVLKLKFVNEASDAVSHAKPSLCNTSFSFNLLLCRTASFNV